MKFSIRHMSTYTYSAPVQLDTHVLRFYPRDDGGRRVERFELRIEPTPRLTTQYQDWEGNRVTQVWFDGVTDRLVIDLAMTVETLRHSAFDYIVDPDAERLDGRCVHHPMLQRYLSRPCEQPEVDRYAGALAAGVDMALVPFLMALSEDMYTNFERVIRDKGEPQVPQHTLASRRGACRDLTVLFVDACRAMGLPARFVSGYQKGDGKRERRYLHAWPEVYIPGGGWRGFDPTHGLAVADGHVAVAAAAVAPGAAPVTGSFRGAGRAEALSFELQIQTD